MSPPSPLLLLSALPSLHLVTSAMPASTSRLLAATPCRVSQPLPGLQGRMAPAKAAVGPGGQPGPGGRRPCTAHLQPNKSVETTQHSTNYGSENTCFRDPCARQGLWGFLERASILENTWVVRSKYESENLNSGSGYENVVRNSGKTCKLPLSYCFHRMLEVRQDGD